jgi:hypothetical protein
MLFYYHVLIGSMSIDTDNSDMTSELGADEAYCSSCGEIIKSDAEVCPECGVRQQDATEGAGSDLADARKYELQKVAGKDQTTIAVVSFLVPFIGYIMVGKTGLAIINVFTLNYLFLGFFIVPFHTYKIIGNAQDQLARNGLSW